MINVEFRGFDDARNYFDDLDCLSIDLFNK